MILDPTQPDRWPAVGADVTYTPYEADALAFCRAWLNDQSSFILHTSGSTGTPKAVRLTRAQMSASAQLTGQTLGLQPGDAALVCLNVRYVAGVMMLVRGLELGLPMTIVEPASHPLAAFLEHNAQDATDVSVPSFAFAAFVPLQMQAMLHEGTLEQRSQTLAVLNGMKAILVGGAPTGPALEQAIQAISAPVYETYGMTETVSHIALRRLNGPEKSQFFTSLDGVELDTDERGCLRITAAATNFKPVQTNDVVELISPTDQDAGRAGRFRLLGRADTIINSGGVKIQPEPIERIVQDALTTGLSDVKPPRLFVAGLPDERLGQQLVLICEGVSIDDNQWQSIRDAIRTQLGPYQVPKNQLTVPQFAETPTGKIDRNATVAQIG